MLARIKGKNVLIVGASRGLGAELAYQLADKGNNLILVARNENLLKDVQNTCAARNVEVTYYVCDIADKQTVQRTVSNILAENPGVDVLIANAAIGKLQTLYDVEDFERMLTVNLLGSVRFLMPFAVHFRKKNAGLIVSINSLVGLSPMPLYHAYGTSKAALRMYMKSLRLSLKETRVRCVNVFPGFFESDMSADVDHGKMMEVSAEVMARKIIRRIEWRLDEIYIPWVFGFFSLIGQMIPTWIYNRLFKQRYFGRLFDIDKYL